MTLDQFQQNDVKWSLLVTETYRNPSGFEHDESFVTFFQPFWYCEITNRFVHRSQM